MHRRSIRERIIASQILKLELRQARERERMRRRHARERDQVRGPAR